MTGNLIAKLDTEKGDLMRPLTDEEKVELSQKITDAITDRWAHEATGHVGNYAEEITVLVLATIRQGE